jgi:hypothetical protein
MTTVAVVALAGWVVALVPARRAHLDIGRFRRVVWIGVGSRRRWLWAVRVSYIAAGWPSIAVALAWWTSQTREVLTEVRAQLRTADRQGPGA